MPLTESQKSQLRKMSADEALEAAYRLGIETAFDAVSNIDTSDDASACAIARAMDAIRSIGSK